ncbi:hypothetical protein HZB89_01620, partial [archaeon]|nr:hypothetical protein [archaeon]
FMQDKFKRCGKYTYYLVGGVQSMQGTLNPEQMVLGVIVEGPSKTSECLERVENFQNFLPEDKGYGLNRMKGTWAGLVKRADAKNAELAEALAESLFGDNSRTTGTESLQFNTNLLEASTDASRKDLIIELRLPAKTAKGEAVKEPLAIQAVVGGKGLIEDKGVLTAKTALKNLMLGGIIQGCVSADHSRIEITDVEKAADLVIKGPDSMKLFAGKTYYDFNVSRNVLDKIKLSLEGIEKFGSNALFGLQEKTGKTFKELGERNETELPANQGKEFRIEANANNTALLVSQAESQKISLVAESRNDGKQARKDILLKPCGITADEMAKRAIKIGNEGTYYANITSLPEGKETGSLCDVLKRIPPEALDKEWLAKSGCIGNTGNAYKSKITWAKAGGLAAYEAACWASCLGCAHGLEWVPIAGQIFGAAETADCAWACVPAGVIGAADAVIGNMNWNTVSSAASGATGGWGESAAKIVKGQAEEKNAIYSDLSNGTATGVDPTEGSSIWPEATAAGLGVAGYETYAGIQASKELTEVAGQLQKLESTAGSPIDDFLNFRKFVASEQLAKPRVKVEDAILAYNEFSDSVIGSVGKTSIIPPDSTAVKQAVLKQGEALTNVTSTEFKARIDGLTVKDVSELRAKQLTGELDDFGKFIDEVDAGVQKTKAGKAVRGELLQDKDLLKLKDAKDKVLKAKEAIDKASKSTSAREINEVKDALNAAGKAAKGAELSKWAKTLKIAKRVTGGLACGLIGNVAGLNAYTFVIESSAKDLGGKVTFTNAFNEGKELELQKNSTVKINVSIDKESGEKRIAVTQVADEKELAGIQDRQRIDDCTEKNYFDYLKEKTK